MIKYFKYELRKNLYTIGCIAVIASILYLVPILTVRREEFETFCNLAEISVIGGILAVGLPTWLFKYRTKRRIVDLYFALPLSHSKIMIVKYLLGLVMIFAPYTAAYWLGALVSIAKGSELMHGIWYVPQYFASLLPIYFLYAISTFAFTRANRANDGGMFIVFWFFAPALAVLFILFVVNDWGDFYYPYLFLPSTPLDITTSYFISRILDSANSPLVAQDTAAMAVGFTFTGLMAAGATVGTVFSERFFKGESAGQISDSWFGYKVMITYYTVCILALLPLSSSLIYIFVVMVIVGEYLLTAAYRRTLKIGKNQVIIFGASILAGIILSLILH